MLAPVNIPYSLWRLVKSAAIIVFFSAFLLAVPFLHGVSDRPLSIGVTVSYWFLAVIAVLAIFSLVQQFIIRSHAIVLHGHGFTYGLPLFSRRTIPWRDIKSLRHIVIGRNLFIAVILNDEKAYLTGLNWLQRIDAKFAILVARAPVTIQSKMFESGAAVAEAMEDYRKRALSDGAMAAH